MEPIIVEFDVDCAPDHAFETWTSRTSLWWPKSHTISADLSPSIVFEPSIGGRIFERDAAGVEHEWGQVTEWDPPERVDFLWHIFFAADQATRVSVTFAPTASGTHIRLYQDGFDALPVDVGRLRRDRTEGAWDEVIGCYRRALEVA